MNPSQNLITPVRKSDFQNLHVDQVMTNRAMEFIQNDNMFMAIRDVTRINVSQASGILSVLDRNDLNRDEMQQRAPTAFAEKGGFGFLDVKYKTDARSLEYDVNAAQAAGASPGRDPELVVPWALAYKAKIHMESLMAAAIFVSGNWYRVVTGASTDGSDSGTAMNRAYWSLSTTDPLSAILQEIDIFLLRTGVLPTSLRFGRQAWTAVSINPLLRAQVAVNVAGAVRPDQLTSAVTTDQLSALISSKIGPGLSFTVSVSSAVKNSGEKGNPSNSFIVPSKDALLAYDAPGQSTDGTVPTGFGRVVFNGVAADGMQVRSFPRPEVGPGGSLASVIDLYNGFVIVDNQLGTYFSGISQ